MRLVTVGHGTLAADALTELFRGAGITSVVDVRSAPGSRHNPQFGRAELEQWLPACGVSYRWEPRLGGFRKTDVQSLNVALRHASFRGYADYMRTPAFVEALDDLLSASLNGCVLADADDTLVCIMCAESLWWRCHRRLIADAATLLRSIPTTHLMHTGQEPLHRLTDGVRVDEANLLVYDVVSGAS